MEIDWPSGVHQVEHDLPVDRVLSFTENPPMAAECLSQAQWLYPAKPAQSRRLFEACPKDDSAPLELLIDAALDIDPDQAAAMVKRSTQPELAYATAIRHYTTRWDFPHARRAALNAAAAGFVALPATQVLLNRDPEAAALLAEMLTFLPAKLSEREMQFLTANMRLQPSLSVQIAERILRADPLPAYRYAAGAYLAVFDRTKFQRLENLFECCLLALQKMDRAGLDRVAIPAFPDDIPSLETPQALAKTLRADWSKLLELQPGRVTLVHFWAAWCPPCRRERPILNTLASKLKDQGLTVLGVNVDTDQRLKNDFEVETLPVALLFNRQGDLVTRLTGEQSEADFLRALEPLLNR
jgi:thiol-disulfide isomerase/thioredoxin